MKAALKVSFAMLAGLGLLVGCSSSDDSGTGGSAGTAGTSGAAGAGGTAGTGGAAGAGGSSIGAGGSTGTAPQPGFVGSCTTTSSGVTVCSDLADCPAYDVQKGCQSAGSTFSASHCPMTDVIGLCLQAATGSGCATLSYFTTSGGMTVAVTKSACTALKGTWSAP